MKQYLLIFVTLLILATAAFFFYGGTSKEGSIIASSDAGSVKITKLIEQNYDFECNYKTSITEPVEQMTVGNIKKRNNFYLIHSTTTTDVRANEQVTSGNVLITDKKTYRWSDDNPNSAHYVEERDIQSIALLKSFDQPLEPFESYTYWYQCINVEYPLELFTPPDDVDFKELQM